MSNQQSGFTLMEVVVVVVIIGILAAIAVPSYRHYIIRNAEAEAQTQIGRLEMDLESWRTTAMSYRGFTPRKVDADGKMVLGYDDADNSIIYVPLGSNATNYRYQIELYDGATSNTSLTPAISPSATNVDVAVGRSWVMLATPNPNGVAGGGRGRIFLQRSTGLRCATPNSTTASLSALTADITTCSGIMETW